MMPMSEHAILSSSEVAEEHQTEAHAPYVWVWFALLVLTVIEYWYASIFKSHFLVLLLGLMLLALVKAGLVGWFFMHLKFEGNWVYILLVPAGILATIIVLALSPDMVLKPATEENPGEDSAWVEPGDDRPTPRIVRVERLCQSLARPNLSSRTFDST
jgi:cytochrome c oxidase subunit IV